jgi:hypothetical protein
VAVVLAGVLTGSELTSRLVVHPTLWKLDHRAQVRAEKLAYRRFGMIDPPLMTATVAACFVAAGRLTGRRAAMAATGGSCYAGMLAVTLAGNVPINRQVLGWDDEGGDREAWRALRQRWDRLHSARIVLDVAGLVLIAAAVTSP